MIRSFISFCLRFLKSRIQLQLEIVCLRKRLDTLTRTSAKPRFRPSDRFFSSLLTNVFSSWKTTLLIIKRVTVIRWHQRGFKLYWRWKSRSVLGRPRILQTQIDLIRQMAADNSEIISLDFFVVPTIAFKVLHVLVFLSHDRGRIIRFNVTDHPTSEWTTQQLRIGSIRRECLDHVIVFNETRLRGILKEYIRYYNAQRTHLGVNKHSPEPREVQVEGEIDRMEVANGLHHFYFRKAA